MAAKSILVPTDFSDHAAYALAYAFALADKLGATVHLVNAIGAALPELTVTLTRPMFDSMRAQSLEGMKELIARRPAGVRIGELIVKDGDARDAIIEAAHDVAADLIVMGTHGRRGLRRVLLGSVAETMVRRAPCPVLTVHDRDVQPYVRDEDLAPRSSPRDVRTVGAGLSPIR